MVAGASLLAIAATGYIVVRGPRATPRAQAASETTAAQTVPFSPPSEPAHTTPPRDVAPAAQTGPQSALLAMMNDEDPEFRQIANSELDTFLLLTRDLPVDETTARALARDLARARAAQLLYQGAIARIVPESSDRTRVNIPAYPAEGKALQDFIVQSLVRALPSETRVAEFWEQSLDAAFSFLGKHPQDLVFTRDGAARRNNAVKITKTIFVSDLGMVATDHSFLELGRLGSFIVYSSAIPE